MTLIVLRLLIKSIEFGVWIVMHPCKTVECIYSPMPDVNGGLLQTAVEVKAWMRNYIPHIIMEIIAYPCLFQLYYVSEKTLLCLHGNICKIK